MAGSTSRNNKHESERRPRRGLTDVKGYYRTLGLAPGAGAAEVKRAYRACAKEAHPDAGGKRDGDAFRRLAEAYEVLGDEVRRADYDALCRAFHEARAVPARDSPAAAARAEPAPEARGEEPEPVRCERCGTVSAQPRYVRFFQVVGRLRTVRERTLAGTFCRACADRVAMRASLATWLLGWWSLPRGPAQSVRALLRNLAGGERPPVQNAALLARQARAFAARGEPELAAGLALQATDFGPDPALDALIAAGGGRRLKDRWRPGGLAFVVQALPLGLALAWALVWAGSKVAAVVGY